jgi:hypothetical protein
MRHLPVGAQKLQQMGREHDIALLVPLSLFDPDHHAVRVDVGRAQRDDFGDPHACGIGSHDQGRCLRLGKLIYLYDDNAITLAGETKLTFSEDVGKRFEAYGWHVQRIDDGNDVEAISKAIAAVSMKRFGPPSFQFGPTSVTAAPASRIVRGPRIPLRS